jgi:magnesium transporter
MSKNRKKLKLHPSKRAFIESGTQYSGYHTDIDTQIEIISYNDTSCVKFQPKIDEFLEWAPQSDQLHWINITGIANIAAIQDICKKFNIHYLYLEDILNVHQRPKMDEDREYIYASFKAINWDKALSNIEEEQYSVLLKDNILFTFEEYAGDHFSSVRDRLHSDDSFFRSRGLDYLFYKLIDITVDNYFEVLEIIGDSIESEEDIIMSNPKNADLERIQNSKKDIIQMRKSVYPFREILNKILNSENPAFKESNKKYFKDVQDHILQIIETTESLREMNISLKDMYLNSLSHEMNKIMKVLTIMSTFFIPLTFLVGVYGMNFQYMPELTMKYGYYTLWAVMVAIVIVLSLWFRRRGWF